VAAEYLGGGSGAAGVDEAEAAEDQHERGGDERGNGAIPAIMPMVPKA
jgi:hypothetical protein